ncbi:MAG TPA: NRDE family protein [Thermoanaerobaculia bacterium]|nr:NRDE family protein [Thermoanaerobaculia bacterium]
MCLIAIAHGAPTKFPLVIAANRDEVYLRPTRPAQVWEDDPRVLGGRDLRAGGSWLALRQGGRFAAITNVRGAGREGGPSRGGLVADFVRGDASPLEFARSVRGEEYAGFHLIVGDGEIVHVSNAGVIGTIEGIFAISNAPAGTRWEKTSVAREFLRSATEFHSSAEDLADDLLLFLSTPRGGAIEHEVFVTSPEYGTRSSTVIVCDEFGDVLFVEQNFGPGGGRAGAPLRYRLPFMT